MVQLALPGPFAAPADLASGTNAWASCRRAWMMCMASSSQPQVLKPEISNRVRHRQTTRLAFAGT